MHVRCTRRLVKFVYVKSYKLYTTSKVFDNMSSYHSNSHASKQQANPTYDYAVSETVTNL